MTQRAEPHPSAPSQTVERRWGPRSGGPPDMEGLQIRSEGRRHVAAYPGLRGMHSHGFVFGWLTLNRAQFASKHIRVVLLPGRICGLPTSENFDTTNRKITPGAIWPKVQGLSTSLNCDRTQATLLVEVPDRETAQVVRRLSTQVPHYCHKAIKADRGDFGRVPTKNKPSSENFHPIDTNLYNAQVSYRVKST